MTTRGCNLRGSGPSELGSVGTTVSLAHGAEIAGFICELEATRWTGRPGYPLRAVVGLALVKAVYGLPTWTRAVRLVGEHDGLRAVLGAAPSVAAAYRFGGKLRAHEDALTACVERVLYGLREHREGFGDTVAIDGSDLPAHANGQRHLFNGGPLREHYSDPDASWGHRSAISVRKGGGYYGFKVHAVVCTATGLPVAWTVLSANVSEPADHPAAQDAVRGRREAPAAVV